MASGLAGPSFSTQARKGRSASGSSRLPVPKNSRRSASLRSDTGSDTGRWWPKSCDVDALAGVAPGGELHPQAAALAQLAVEVALEETEGGGAVGPLDGGGHGQPAARVEQQRHVTGEPFVAALRLYQPCRPGLGSEARAGDLAAAAVVGEQHLAVAQARVAAAEGVEGVGGGLLELAVEGHRGVAEEVPDQSAGEQPQGDADEYCDHRDRQHADEEVGEGELAADPPEKEAKEADAAPQQHQHQRRGEQQHEDAAVVAQPCHQGADQKQADEDEQQRGSLADHGRARILRPRLGGCPRLTTQDRREGCMVEAEGPAST